MDVARAGQAVADYIDEHHPRLGSRLMQLRWGGLRTLEPEPWVLAGVLASGVACGVALRCASGRRGDGRARLPALRAALVATAGMWLGLWRWDAARWRRSHVMVVVDTTSEGLDTLVASLRAEGLDVERWDRTAAADGPRRGVSCRLRDLRRVNSLIDERG